MPFPVDLHILATFTIASFVLLAIPGPTIIMVISQALAHGRHAALATVPGVGLGDLVAATLSLIGVGTILAASAAAFTAIKWLGACYLVWVGIKMWREPVSPLHLNENINHATTQKANAFRDAFFVTLFNPKGIVFFLAFVPQFITPDYAFAPQAAVLIFTFVTLGMINAAAYAILASTARNWIKQPRILRRTTRTGAVFLISAGIASIFVKRTA